ncbi:hypothetical protein DPMN_047787 [Dreissena polymorpha]|uniref:Uncharacterized protein n=1 Tax=Dreissena polymorpha TaxID=45954 RepID=A0A9D4I1Q9_DREPO|nr:hypothetical protein DPMN_047787 [Dreissena polymorpha]
MVSKQPNIILTSCSLQNLSLDHQLVAKEDLIRGAQCLQPEVRDQDHAEKLLTVLCNALPTAPDKTVSSITDELKVYRAEEIPKLEMYDKNDNLKIIEYY